jgi:pyruvate/2-oxoglutarate dehydrogenase complex dihydrolipoamide dehydrogenase (E3) component
MPGVVVLGGGSTGQHFCDALRRLDADVPITLVESNLVGGECSYFACMPSKTLLRAPELSAAATRAPGLATWPLDVKAIFAWRDWVTSDWHDDWAVEWLDGKRVELVRGKARVLRPGVVEADGQELEYETLVVSTGSAPVTPAVAGLAGVESWSTADATSSHHVPATLIVLGGGVAGCELGQLYRRLGSEVTIVQHGTRLLPRSDPEAGEALQKAFEEEGIRVLLDAEIESVESLKHHGAAQTAARLASGERLTAERLLLAAGRRPNVDGLGLDQLGVEVSPGGIKVDERLRAAENVYAIGDVTGQELFTHVGKYEARVAAANIAGADRVADYRAVPAVAFTDPQIATVGRTEGEELVFGRWDIERTSRSSTYERPKRHGFLKLAADPARSVLVGAVAVGPEAGEWCQQLTLAIRAEVPIATLLDVIQPFPTFSEAVLWALLELPL